MAARKPPLRAVAPGETKPAAPKTVAQAAASGDHRALLVAMRERIAVTVSNPDCPPRDLAAHVIDHLLHVCEVRHFHDAVHVTQRERDEAARDAVACTRTASPCTRQ